LKYSVIWGRGSQELDNNIIAVIFEIFYCTKQSAQNVIINNENVFAIWI